MVRRAAAAAQVFVADLDHPVPTADDDHHLARVLRLRAGSSVVAADGTGAWRLCTYHALGAALEPTGPVAMEPARPPVTVAFAPMKGERFEWAFAKLVELGVDRICLLATDRAVVRFGEDRAERQRLRLGRLAHAAATQCRRVTLPELIGPMTLAEAARAIDGLARCDLDGEPAPAGLSACAVGAEGGWSDAERALELPSVGLGTTVLRAETAAVTAGALLTGLRDGWLGSAATPVNRPAGDVR